MIYITDNALLKANTTAILTTQYDEPAKLNNVGETQAILEKSNDGVVWEFLASIAPQQAQSKELDYIFIRNISNTDVYIQQRTYTTNQENQVNETPIVDNSKPVFSDVKIADTPNLNLWKTDTTYKHVLVSDSGFMQALIKYPKPDLNMYQVSKHTTKNIFGKDENGLYIDTAFSVELTENEKEFMLKTLEHFKSPDITHTVEKVNDNYKFDVSILLRNLPEPVNDRLSIPMFGGYLGLFNYSKVVASLETTNPITKQLTYSGENITWQV